MTKISWRNSSIVGATKRASNLFLERIQEKWVPVFRPNARPNKDLQRFRNSVKFGNALVSVIQEIR